MKTLLNIITIIIALVGAVLAIADKIEAITAIDPNLAKYWPVVVSGAIVIGKIATLVGDFLDNGKVDGSFRAMLSLAVALGVCFLANTLLTGCLGSNLPPIKAEVCYVGKTGDRICGTYGKEGIGVKGEVHQRGDGKTIITPR